MMMPLLKTWTLPAFPPVPPPPPMLKFTLGPDEIPPATLNPPSPPPPPMLCARMPSEWLPTLPFANPVPVMIMLPVLIT